MTRHAIARLLLARHAVSLAPSDPFTWASGLRSPIYCDNRLLISDVSARRQVLAAFIDKIRTSSWEPECIAGTATAGIPHAAWLAEALSLPMVYVRGSEKRHGKKNRVEGKLTPGMTTLLIEDLISTGGSAIDAAEALRQNGAAVIGVLGIFQYGLGLATQRFADSDLEFATLSDFEALLEVVQLDGDLSETEWESLNHWRADPQAWSARYTT